MRTPRQNRPDATIRVDPMLVQIAFPEACGRTADAANLQIGIRRVGSCEDKYVLGYNAFGRDPENRVAFRLDGQIHDLDEGYYDAVLLDDCVPCGVVRLDMTKQPALDMRAPALTTYTECPPPGEALPGTGHDDMFERYLGWTSKAVCAIDATTTLIKTSVPLPLPLPDTPPQLVIRDGVASEAVDVVAVGTTGITVVRGQPSYQFPVGACVQFEWTEANILAVANQSCPVVDPASDTDAASGGTSCTVLEAGKGINLNTSQDGKIIVELQPTNVVPGTYGGLVVDDCGRVATIDADFPAAGIPVFDQCCKADDEEETAP